MRESVNYYHQQQGGAKPARGRPVRYLPVFARQRGLRLITTGSAAGMTSVPGQQPTPAGSLTKQAHFAIRLGSVPTEECPVTTARGSR